MPGLTRTDTDIPHIEFIGSDMCRITLRLNMLPMMALMRAPSPLHNYRVCLELFSRLQTQKSPQSFHLAGSQDFDEGSGNPQPRILVELAGVEPASEITTPSALHA